MSIFFLFANFGQFRRQNNGPILGQKTRQKNFGRIFLKQNHIFSVHLFDVFHQFLLKTSFFLEEK